MLVNLLVKVAELESDPIRTRTREDMQITQAKGGLRGKWPKFSPPRKSVIVLNFGTKHTSAEMAELFGVTSSAVNRILQ